MASVSLPTFAEIVDAHRKIMDHIHKTPVMTSQGINRLLDAEIFFKCENFQKVGAFKFRGATNAVLSLADDEVKRGVATHSSGNHAAALALAAQIRGARSYIVMPENSPNVKKRAVAGYGAEIRFCKPTLDAREQGLEQVVSETGAAFIHPYNNHRVICGQGTAALELITQVEELDIVLAPVGGGGLLSGTATAVKGGSSKAKVIGAEPEAADDAYRSFRSGKLIPADNPKTVADGLRTSLAPLTFDIIMDKVDDIITTKESTIIDAMRLIWERMKIVVEPSAAVPLAALMDNKLDVSGKKVGIILSGGNVDLDNLPFGN